MHIDDQLDDGDALAWERPGDGRRCARAHPGSIAAVFAQDRVLVAGDAIASHDGRPMLGVFNADPAQARSSLRRLAGLDVDLACFGHGDPLLSGAHDAWSGSHLSCERARATVTACSPTSPS